MRKAASVHAHPFSTLTFLYRFLFLLIIPLARGFLSALTGDLLSWISGAWMDILTVLLIFLLAWKKWDCFKYYMDECGVFYTSGIFFRRETFIPVDRICTCAVMRPFWLRPLKVARLRVDTIARGANKADVSFYVGEREAARILSLCRGVPEESADEVHAAYRPRISGVVFLSLFTSNSFLGIVFISTFISQAGQILGQELADLMLATFEELSRRVAFGLPPIAAASRSRCSSDGSPHSCSTCCKPRISAPSASGTPSTSAAACLWKRNISCAPATSASSTSGRAF